GGSVVQAVQAPTSACRQRRVVYDEGRLQRGVLTAAEAQRHRLARERTDVERALQVAAVLVQVRVRRQRRRAELDRQLVVRGRGGRLGRVDVQIERQRRAAPRRDRDRLGERVGVRGAVAVQPGLPATAV